MRLLPSAMAFLTSSRSREVSSPNTIRPLHSMARIPSTVRFVSFNCIKHSFAACCRLCFPLKILRQPAYRLSPALASPHLRLFSASSVILLSDLGGQKLLPSPATSPADHV